MHLDTTHVPPHCSFQQSAIEVPRVSLAGQETFQVDSALILAKSLRGIGRSFQSIISGIIDGDLSVFGRFIEADAQLALPGGGGPAPVTDPAVANFVATTLVFPPGVDRTSVFDVREKWTQSCIVLLMQVQVLQVTIMRVRLGVFCFVQGTIWKSPMLLCVIAFPFTSSNFLRGPRPVKRSSAESVAQFDTLGRENSTPW